MLAGAEQGNGLIKATLPGGGALGGGDVAGVIPPHAVGELAEEYAGLLIGRERGGEAGRERVSSCGVSATVRVTRMGSTPFTPVALRTAALMLIMCLPPITLTVFRAEPVRWPAPRTSGSVAAGALAVPAAGASAARRRPVA